MSINQYEIHVSVTNEHDSRHLATYGKNKKKLYAYDETIKLRYKISHNILDFGLSEEDKNNNVHLSVVLKK